MMIRWMRTVLPPTEYLIIFFFLYGLATGLIYYYLGPSAFAAGAIDLNIFHVRDAIVLLGAIAYGVYRGVAMQPALREEYMRFLKLTPWSPRKPLPLGPIHLVAQDIVVAVLFLLLTAHRTAIPPAHLLFCGLAAYLFCLTLVFLQCRLWKYYYLVAFGIGLSVAFWSTPIFSFITLLLVYGFASLGIRQLLVMFDQTAVDDFPFWSSLGLNANNRTALLKKLERLSGWPFDVLAPKKPSLLLYSHGVHGIALHHGILVSLLIGWWAFAVAVPFYDREHPRFNAGFMPQAVWTIAGETSAPVHLRFNRTTWQSLIGLNFYLFLALAGMRVALYAKGHHPPIDLGGRLLTGRWIIPKYDVIFIAPLCTFLSILLPFPLIGWLRISPLFVGPLTIAVMVFCTLAIGPRRVDWLLTSPCRIVPSYDYKNKAAGEFSDS